MFIDCPLWTERGLPGGLMVKNHPANAGDSDLILGSGKSPGGEYGIPLQYSCLEEKWGYTESVHGAVQSQT